MQKSIPLLLILATFLISCRKDESLPDSLEAYIMENDDRELSNWLVACAGGMPEGWMGDEEHPISVFFLPENNAWEFRYFESESADIDINDYSNFTEIEFEDEPVLNGKLWRFKHTGITSDRWGIVTYKTEGKLHVCEAIRLKVLDKPTQNAPVLIDITENGVTPYFQWEDGLIEENVIYFQVVADLNDNIISGTYTYDKWWQFYDTSNVVLNIHNVSPSPSLQTGQQYKFILMGVSEDNWVNLMGEKTFGT